MFTGIITDLGRVRAVSQSAMTRLEIETKYPTESIAIGASIACNGVCLSVVEHGPGWFAVEASAETLSKTTLGSWRQGAAVNLERPLKLGDELGGHLVLGHVDGVGAVVERRQDGGSVRLTVKAPPDLARFVAPKGSIAIDGVSLTLVAVEHAGFDVALIPHTLAATNLADRRPGDRVNLEADVLGKYVQKYLERIHGAAEASGR